MGRKQTEETKAKLRAHYAKGLKEKVCKQCKEKFSTRKKSQELCSRSCSIKFTHTGAKRSDKTRQNISEGVLNNYKNGKQVYGGTTKWWEYKGIKVQGTYELRTCKILDKWKDSKLIKDWEYTNDKVSYIGEDNKKHTYLLDFKVFTNDGEFYYIETKGYEKPNDKLKWDAVRSDGLKLEVWFNEDILLNEKW